MGRVKSNWAFALLAAASLSGCGVPPSHIYDTPETLETMRQANSYVGHDYWNAGTHVYAVNETLGIGWVKTAGGRMRFDSVDHCLSRMCTFHVTFANGIAGYITTDLTSLKYDVIDHEPPPVIVRAFYPSFLDRLKGPEAERRRHLPGVSLGMVKAQVLSSAWAEPNRKSEIESRTYFREIWFYPEGNELHFEDGRLAKIKN